MCADPCHVPLKESSNLGFVHIERMHITLHWEEMAMDHVADGHLGLGLNCRWPYHLGLNCRVSHFRLMTSPGLKLPTQFQVANENIFKFDILKFMIS